MPVQLVLTINLSVANYSETILAATRLLDERIGDFKVVIDSLICVHAAEWHRGGSFAL
jgi:hypothetical protein